MTNKQPTRASQTREKTERKKVWTPPSYLDTPNAPDGFRHRWVRTEVLGYVDTKNVQGRLRSGYELVRADEYGEEGKYSGVIGHGGLVLTRVPIEIAQQRAAYYANLASENVEAVDNDLMKEQDRRMPINIDKQSRTTFGGKKS